MRDEPARGASLQDSRRASSRPPIRAVLFDVGGVLVTTPTTRWQARWEAALGLPPDAIDVRLADVYAAGTIGTLSVTEAEARIAEALGLDEGRREALMDDYWAEYLGAPNVRLLAWLRTCRPRLKTGILSNSWVGAREREQARYGFADLCDAIVYSHEEGIAKPAPRIYAIACERLAVAPEEVVFIDDLRANVEAARELGMHGVVFNGETSDAIRDLRAAIGENA